MFPEQRTEDPNRRYTTREFMEWIKRKAGVDAWDLDVAADAESHHAPRWYSLLPYEGSAGVDGLAQSWLPPYEWFHTYEERLERLRRGPRVPGVSYSKEARTWRIFCNPPFDDLASWVARAWRAVELANADTRLNGLPLELRIGFVLPGNRHEQGFWQDMVEPFRDGREVRHSSALDCHFPPGRQAYAKPGSNGAPVGSADFPSCLLVWRRAC